MSRVVEQIKAKYPSYRDVPDDELTVAIGKKYPTYLEQDPGFASDFKRLTEPKAAPAATAATATVGIPQNPDPLYRYPLAIPPGTFQEEKEQGGEDPAVMAEVQAEIARSEEIGSISAHEPSALERLRRTAAVRQLLGPTTEEREGALESSKPHPSPVDVARQLVHMTTLPAPLTTAALEMTSQAVAGQPEAIKGAVKGLVETAMGTPIALPVGGRLVSGAFAVDLASQLPELKHQFDVAVKEGNTEEAWKVGTTIAATGAFAGLAAKHAISERRVETPKQALETAAVQAEVAQAPATAEALKVQAEKPTSISDKTETLKLSDMPSGVAVRPAPEAKVVAPASPKAEKVEPAQPELSEYVRVKAPPRTEVAGDYEQFGPEGKLKVVAKSKDGKRLLVHYEAEDPFSAPVEVDISKVFSMKKRVKAAEPSPEDLAEREAIDAAAGENEAAGLPSKVIIEGTTPKTASEDPFSRDRIAYVDSMGNIRINQPVFREWLKNDVREGSETEAVSALLRHEGIHAVGRQVIPDADFAAIYNGLTAPEKAVLQKAYTGETKGVGHTDVQMGHEYVRRAMERLMGGPVSERVATKGLERITQPVLDIIERIIIAARKLVGKNKDLQSILDRMQANVKGERKGVVSIEEPQAYYRRKSKPGEGQEEMKMEEGKERISATEARRLTQEPVTPGKIIEAADRAMVERLPDFNEFAKEAEITYGATPGQLREAWEDAVWRRAERELGAIKRPEQVEYLPSPREELLKRAAELEDMAATPRAVGDLQFDETPAQRKEALLKRAEEYRAEAQKASDAPVAVAKKRDYKTPYRPGEERAENRIATRALKTITQAQERAPAPLKRTTVTPEDVRVGQPDAFIEFEAKDKVSGAELVKDSSVDRTTKIREMVSEGVAETISRKRPAETETKRVTALLNEKTGEVQLVSTFADKDGNVMVFDPRFSQLSTKKERLNIRYDKLANDAPEWKPIASVLLDEPVQGFRQHFSTREEFEGAFASRVRENYDIAQRSGESPAIEGEAEGAPRLKRGGTLTETESNALFDTLVDEVAKIESPEDIDSLFVGLRDRAQSGTLTAKDWTAINALDKIHTAVEADNPSVLPNEIISRTKDRLYSLAKLAESGDEFVSLAMEQFAGERKSDAPKREVQPQAKEAPYRQVAERRRAAQSMAEAAAESQALQDALAKSERLSPSFYDDVLNPDVNAPEAFLRRGSSADRGLRGSAKLMRSLLNATLFRAARVASEGMVGRLRRVAQDLSPYERGVVEDVTFKYNEIISRTRGHHGEMMSRFGDDLLALAGRLATEDKRGFADVAINQLDPRTPRNPSMWLNDVQVIEKNGTAIRNSKEAIEGRLRAPDAETQKFVDSGQEGNYLTGLELEKVSPNFIANGGMSSQLTPLGFDIIGGHATKRDSLRERVVRGNARANGVSESDMRLAMNSLRQKLAKPGLDTAGMAAIAQDFARKFPRLVTDVWVGNGVYGHWEPIIHSNFLDYFQHGIRRAAMIKAFREIYPKGDPSFNQDYAAMRKALDSKWHPLLDATLRTLQGQPSEGPLHAQAIGAIENIFPRANPILGPLVHGAYDAASPLFRAMMLTQQIALQPGELMSGANAVFWGYKRSFKDTFARYAKDYGAMEQAGLVDRMMYNDSIDPQAKAKTTGRIASNLIRRVALENVVNEMQEAQNAKGALITARRIIDEANGGPKLPPAQKRELRNLFEYMEFSRDEIDQMMDGNELLLLQMQRKAASWFSGGNRHPAERSRLFANRLFQKAYWFQDYPMTRLNQLINVVDTGMRHLENGRYREAANSMAKLVKFGYGTAAQGILTTGFLTMFGGGLYGLLIKKHEATDEPVQFTAEAMRAAMGGPLQAIINGYEDRGLYGVLDNAGKLATPTPASVATDLWQAAFKRGKYRDIARHEALMRFVADKTPGYKALKSGIALDLLGSKQLQEDSKMTQALKAFYRWRRENYGGSTSDSNLKEDTREEFRVAMRKVQAAMLKGDMDAAGEALSEAALGKAKQFELEKKDAKQKDVLNAVAHSLKSRHYLKIPLGSETYRDMRPDEIEKLEKHIGEDPVRRLIEYDALLDAVADEIRK